MAVLELPQEQKDLIEEIARFRNGLEPIERQILDAVVKQGCEPNETRIPQSQGDDPPGEDDVARLVAKIEAFEETLPGDHRQLLDEILAAGSHDQMDVEAHRTVIWRAEGGSGPAFWVLYMGWCQGEWGVGANLSYAPYWWTGFTWGEYECWKW
jgi:hypothetical protein